MKISKFFLFGSILVWVGVIFFLLSISTIEAGDLSIPIFDYKKIFIGVILLIVGKELKSYGNEMVKVQIKNNGNQDDEPT